MSNMLQLDAPSIGVLEKRYITRALRESFVSTYGPYVGQFEEKFKKSINRGFPVALQSGTAALHLALHELGIGPGDEVIVPGLTFIASVNPVLYQGAKPVLVDVDPQTWNISLAAIEAKITKKTKGIIAVHLYGNCCAMEALIRLARRYDLYLIEDATESLGSYYAGRHTGSFGDYGCFSFNGNKMITTGGGGLLLCPSQRTADHARLLANQGRPGTDYIHTALGFNYRMTNLEASLGLAQLERLPAFLKKKQRFRQIYAQGLEDLPLRLQAESPKANSCFWLNAVVFENAKIRQKIEDTLKKARVPFRRLFAPLPESQPYQGRNKRELKNAYDLYEKGLCLPSSVTNSEQQIWQVCHLLQKALL